jgi:tetratricopeptide (TPR) repeat protein
MLHRLAWTAAVMANCLFVVSEAAARGPSMGRVGGGGARPGGMGGGGFHGGEMGGRGFGGGGMARPAGNFGGGEFSGGGMSRPSMPNINLPSLGNAGGGMANISRPSLPNTSRPSLGGIGGGDFARPSLPGGGNRPVINPPGAFNPATRPGAGGGGIQRPDFGGDRPSLGNVTRPISPPGFTTRPGAGGSGEQFRPGGDNRPGGGGLRPDRPVIGGGGDFRPGGGGNLRPDRPVIGGGGNTIIGGGNNIIGGGNVNRPGWGLNNRPGGDWWSQQHNWQDNWHDHCINDHHDWYHGCWNNHWGYAWYAPVAWGGVGWGLGSWYGGGSYYNPYYDTSAASAMPYDYSQPVVVNNYVAPDPNNVAAQQPASAPPTNNAALTQFDQGLADFKAGSYRQSLTQFDAALKQLPSDPVVHEVRALSLFAIGDYRPAAASLNSLLATAPGMDWTTMAGLYGNVNDYTQQLRALEQHCKANASDAPAYFVLAYHYLVTGHQEDAARALQVVVKAQPRDATAKKMLDSLTPQPDPATAVAATPPATAPGEENGPATDLVGSWQAKSGDSTINLTIGDDSQFTWQAEQKGQKPIELKGEVVATSDTLVLDNKQQGSMVGRVKSDGPDKWQFALAGGPPGDSGLSFQRAKR